MIMTLCLASLGGAAVASNALHQAPRAAQLQARAQKIFDQDARKERQFSNKQIMGLSVALGFGDLNGAEAILNQIEQNR
jgi:hypothetical protein